ncbi:glycosyltransferase [Rhodococcus gordoniae]|uniref:glycosyltransferase n=1 Tax=Rhodococcus gordoniae TaxID=223392 RepID=UPI0020CBAE5D|nr:glycosyltransferase [Rhodococcus gordoniae]UTT48040.1 glycosyltransferase [Rhodococcus gordoniae]
MIVHYHREKDAIRLVRTLQNIGINSSNIAFCNNGASREFVRNFSDEFPEVKFLNLDNVGFGAAMNAGLRVLPGRVEYALLLSHEVELEASCLDILMSELRDNPVTVAVGPRLMSNETTVWSLGGGTSRFFRKPANIGRGTGIEAIRAPTRHEVDWLDGSIVLVDRAKLATVDNYSESYFLYFEDVDLGWKIRESGGKVVCRTDAQAFQTPGGHLNHVYAVRNLLWLLRKQRFYGAYFSYIFENVFRLVLGGIFKPRGYWSRARGRASGLKQGILPQPSRRSS